MLQLVSFNFTFALGDTGIILALIFGLSGIALAIYLGLRSSGRGVSASLLRIEEKVERLEKMPEVVSALRQRVDDLWDVSITRRQFSDEPGGSAEAELPDSEQSEDAAWQASIRSEERGETLPSSFELEHFRQILSDTLRPPWRLIDLEISSERMADQGFAHDAVQHVAEFGLDSWIYVSYVIEDASVGGTLVGAINAYITIEGEAVKVLHHSMIGDYVELPNRSAEFDDQIIGALSKFVQSWMIAENK